MRILSALALSCLLSTTALARPQLKGATRATQSAAKSADPDPTVNATEARLTAAKAAERKAKATLATTKAQLAAAKAEKAAARSATKARKAAAKAAAAAAYQDCLDEHDGGDDAEDICDAVREDFLSEK